ncbi:MAG: tetratricopeptide repeat protein [Candidatus Acidiferrales bacterium]
MSASGAPGYVFVYNGEVSLGGERIVLKLALKPILRLEKLAASGAIAAIFIVGSAPHAAAQNAMTSHSMDMREEVPPEKLPPPQKLTGIGNAHIHITATPEAQMWFDQGLNLLHDFWDYESDRAFEQSVRVDPRCVMCYWGIYQAEKFSHSNSKYYADQSLAKAVSLKNRASKSERLYIEASAAAEAAERSEKDDSSAGDSKEVQLYRKLVKHDPQDMQARIFLAEALSDGYDDDDQPRAGQKEAMAILQGVLKEDPENSAANHYWIHAVEPSQHPEQALHSAEILGRLAPTSGHMVHMSGHIFYRVGDYARAKESFAASMKADEAYMQAQHVQVDDDWNYVHNLMYAIANLMELGELDEATALSAKLRDARGELENTLYPWSPRDAMSRLDPRLPVALRSADWATALTLLKSSDPPAALPNLQFLARQLTRFALGMQALEAHDLSQAETASAQFDAGLWRISQRLKDEENAKSKEKEKDKNKPGAAPPKLQVMPDAMPKPLVSNLSIMSLELRAGLLMAKKQNADAKKLFAQAAREEKELGYREPPAYIRPVGETEAAAFMAASDWTDAKAAYKEALVDRPHSGFPLYGIALASEQAGDTTAATSEYADFLAAWKSADKDLPQLVHARAYVASHNEAAGSK